MSENAKSGVFFSQSDFRGIYMCHSQKKHQKTVNFHQIILYILTLLYSEYQWDFNGFRWKIIGPSPTKVFCGTLGARIVTKTCARHS